MAEERHYNSIPIPKRVEDRPTEDDLTGRRSVVQRARANFRQIP